MLSQPWRDRAALALLGSVLFLPFLGSMPLWDFDEAYFGSIAQEMVQRNEWVVPTYNGVDLGDKPVFLFWGMRLSFLICGGVTEFAARFPAALWGIGTLLLVYQVGLRLFSRAVAWRASFILATMLMFCLESRAVTTDMVLLFWCVAAVNSYLAGIYQPRSSDSPLTLKHDCCYFTTSLGYTVLFYACLGVAVLCKGPVFFVLPMAVIGLFMLIKTYPKTVNPFYFLIHFLRTCARMRLPLGIAVVLLVAAPWYIAVGVATDWEWWDLFFWKHNFARATTVMHNARGPFYYYLPAFLFGTFPWSLFFIPVLVDFVRRWREPASAPVRDGLLLMSCWSGVVVIAFTLVATKFPSYIVPMYPAAAFIYAHFFERWRRSAESVARWWTPVALSVFVVVGVAAIVAFAVVVPKYFAELLPGEERLAIVGLVILLCSLGTFTASAFSRRSTERVLQISAVVMLATFFWWAGPRVAQHHEYRPLLATLQDKAAAQNENLQIAAVGCLEPSWVFYFQEPIHKLEWSGENSWQAFLNDTEHAGVSRFVLMRSTDFDKIGSENNSFCEVARVRYWGRPYHLVAVARPTESILHDSGNGDTERGTK